MSEYAGLNSCPTLALLLPEQPLSFAPAFVVRLLGLSGEFLRGHGSEMARVLMQSLAEFLEDRYGFSIAG